MSQEILVGPERRRRWSDGEKIAIVVEAAGLADVLARINDHMNPKLDELLPWNWKSTGQTEVKAA